MSVGNKIGFPGEAVPLHGNSEIRQNSSATDVVTLTMASGATTTAAGYGLAILKSSAGTISSAAGTVFRVDYDGIQERRHIVTISTASTGYTPATSQSGAFFVIPGDWSSAMTITLPVMEAGLWYEFYVGGSTIVGSAATIAAATAGEIVTFNDVAADSVIMGATGTSVGGSIRFLSDGTKWYAIPQPAMTSAALATTNMTCFNWS